MKELADLLAEAASLRRAGSAFAVASVVKVHGSAYRRPGARMLVRPDGSSVGSISGGCLEGEVIALAKNVLADGVPLVHAFELSEDDHIAGFGLGCGGDIHVLIEKEPDAKRASVTHLLSECRHSRADALLATAIGPPEHDLLGRRLLALHDGRLLGDLVGHPLQNVLAGEAGDLMHLPRPHIRSFEIDRDPVEVLFEVIRPPVQLAIFGDGPDAKPMIRIGRELGWHTVLVGRKTLVDLRTRFREADQHLSLMHAEDVLAHVALDRWSAAIVMSHNFIRDRDLLAQLIPSPARYVGALGPRERSRRMLDELKARGVSFRRADLERFHGPVGLDIGTESPEEIALAVAAEIQAIFQERSGGHLRERTGPIHEPVPVD